MDFLYVESKNDMFLEEQNNLENNIKEIKENIESKNNFKKKLKDECDNYKGDYENRGYFVECNNKLRVLNEELAFLEKVIDSPYFGHMILSLDNEIIDIFIGYNSIDNSKLKKIVHDWRAPICNLFYANQTNYRYKNFLYELTLKRNLVIENKKLIECAETYNNSEEENNDINDYFLRKLIKQKKDEKGFTDIIQSIQQKQNEIIRSDLKKDLLCQGVAGSGKTAIIVHRISYLLFNNTNILPEHFLFIAPNDNFKKELNELNKKLQIDRISLKTLYEYYIDKLNSYINDDEKNDIKTIIDDTENDIKNMYSIDNVEKKFDIMKKLFLELINKYEKIFNLNLEEEESLVEKSKKLYQCIFEIIEKSKKQRDKLKQNINTLDIELKHKINLIFINNIETSKLEGNYLEQINNKFDKLKQEYSKNDFNNINEKIKENKEKIRQNELLIKENIKEKEKKSRNNFFTKLFNKKAWIEQIEKIDKKVNLLKDDNTNIHNELEKLENISKQQNYIIILDTLKRFAKMINDFFNELNDKYKYLELTNHEYIDLKMQYEKIMNKIYNANYNENLKELEKIEYEVESIKNEFKSIDWNMIKNEKEILSKVKSEFSPRNVIMLYLNNIGKEKYDLSKNLSNIKFYRNDAFLILSIMNKIGFDNKIQYHYLYIDEAQDYNDQEIMLLKELEKSNINIFGDYRQNISSNSVQRENWDDLKKIINCDLKYYELNENYRNTIKVVNYCNKNLKLNMLAVGTEGNDVEVKENRNIKDIMEDAEKKDAVVITNNEQIISKINKKSKIRVFRIKEVKGLEFKNAIVIDDDLDNNSKYIAYTRTLNDLLIYRNLKREEEEIMLEAIEKDSSALEYASEKLKNDKEFILQAIEKNRDCFLFAGDELKNDKGFMLQLIKQDSLYLLYASDELKNNEEVVLNAIYNNAMSLLFASDELKDNKKIVLKAIGQIPWTLAFASENLKNDKEIILKAIEKDWLTLVYASDELKNDKEIVWKAIEKNGLTLAYASIELRNNKEFMLQAIKKDGICLIFANDELRKNKEWILEVLQKIGNISEKSLDEIIANKKIMMNIVSKSGETLRYASDELKNDKEFMLQAIEKDCWCVIYASDELKNNKEFMLRAIEKDCWCVKFTSDELRNNKEFMLQAIEKDGLILAYASDELKNNKEFMLKAIKKARWCVIYASDELKNDKEFMLQVIEKDSWFLVLASEKLKDDKEFILQAIERNSHCITYASDELKNDKEITQKVNQINNDKSLINYEKLDNDKEFMLKAIEKDDWCLQHISPELRNDKEFMLQVIEKRDVLCLAYASIELRNDKEFILQAIERDHLSLLFANDELKNDEEFMLQVIEKVGSLCLDFASDELKNDKEFMLQAIEKDHLCLVYASNTLRNDEIIL